MSTGTVAKNTISDNILGSLLEEDKNPAPKKMGFTQKQVLDYEQCGLDAKAANFQLYGKQPQKKE